MVGVTEGMRIFTRVLLKMPCNLNQLYQTISVKQKKPSFKLSKLVTIVYDDEDLQAKVKKVLSYIAWLLEKA
ncbi:5295_t:CDS:2 [Dentiscutata heterogama]|uniref:5295_t:CDS:1 n=1 Tax=Dentiscutata heterogama TaxID=1316150 RepID=A0ACA9LIY0_9GLOM|nr:5295_t:CDS:2 [Dentiscutata heterogama]